MGFSSLLGNDELKKTLTASLQNRHISHFYILSGPKGSGKHTLAELLAAAILCDEPDSPCLRCHSCRKVTGKLHPDVITVDDPEHKNVAVRIVRQFREDAFIRPNEADYKIYIFPQDLGIEGQNALLKILEEPPSYGVFLLLTDNPENLLPTVRSRGTLLSLRPLPRSVLEKALTQAFPKASVEDLQAAMDRSGGFLGQAKTLLEEGESLSPQTLQFLEGFGSGDGLKLTMLLCPMEKWKRDQLIPELQQWLELVEGALACQNGLPSASAGARQLAAQRSSAELLQAAMQLQKTLEYARGNVSTAAICGYLAWVLR